MSDVYGLTAPPLDLDVAGGRSSLLSRAVVTGLVPASLPALEAHYRADRIQGETLFSDAFDDASIAAEWTQVTGAWTESGGKVTAPASISLLINTGANAAGGVYQTTLTLPASAGGIVFRYTNSTKFLLVNVGTVGTVELYKNNSGFTLLASASPGGGIAADTPHLLRVVNLNRLIRVYFNEVHLFDHILSTGDMTTFQAGTGAGFRSNTSTSFDDYSITTVDYDQPANAIRAVDTFTRGDSTNLGNEEGPNARAWSEATANWAIASNKLEYTHSAGVSTSALVEVSSANVDISADVLYNSTYSSHGLMWEGTSESEGLVCLMSHTSAGKLLIYKIVGGAFTQLGSVVLGTFVNGTTYSMRVIADGSDAYIYLDDVAVLTVDISSYAGTGTKAGLWGNNTATGLITFDNFSVVAAPKVPVWFDLSGNGLHRVQTTPAFQRLLIPDQTPTSLAGLVGDQTDDEWDTSGLTGTTIVKFADDAPYHPATAAEALDETDGYETEIAFWSADHSANFAALDDYLNRAWAL